MKDDRKYSGKASLPFWKRIIALNTGVENNGYSEMYRLATILQDLEEFVLDRLVKAEKHR